MLDVRVDTITFQAHLLIESLLYYSQYECSWIPCEHEDYFSVSVKDYKFTDSLNDILCPTELTHDASLS
jgi:hypothetical protein